jgi:plasmid stability protein
MHRTQIILEDWQYQALRARAEREDRSISELVRDILRTSLAQPPRRKSQIQTMEGVGQDRLARGRQHDAILYGSKSED